MNKLPEEVEKEWKEIRNNGVEGSMADFYDKVENFLADKLAESRRKTAREISNWTKGHAVTKERLREYLNKNYLK